MNRLVQVTLSKQAQEEATNAITQPKTLASSEQAALQCTGVKDARQSMQALDNALRVPGGAQNTERSPQVSTVA